MLSVWLLALASNQVAWLCRAEEGSCSAPGECGDINSRYYWPYGKGHPQHFGKSPYSFGGPACDLTAKLKWSWHNRDDMGGKYAIMIMGGPIIDDKKQIYLTIGQGMIKFSPEGQIIWYWQKPGPEPWFYLMDTPAIMDGLIYNVDTGGTVHAVDMETGQLRWSQRHAISVDGDNGFLVARDGRVLLEVDPHGPREHGPPAINRVLCLNGTTGDKMWEFKPDIGVWNFLPLHVMDGDTPDGTIVFQSWIGSVYRVNVSTGEQIWRSGTPVHEQIFTDGGHALGENGLMYAVTNLERSGRTKGGLHAFNVSNGNLMWEHRDLEAGLWTWPVVATLHEGGPLTVVTGVGMLAGHPYVLLYYAGVFYFSKWGAGIGFAVGACFALWRFFSKGCSGRGIAALILWTLLGVAIAALVVFPFVLWKNVPNEFPYSIHAYDANTGARLWRVQLPTWYWPSAAGDEAGVWTRSYTQPWRPIALPCASSYPTVDAQGIVYLVHMDGHIYRIKDWNNDNIIEGESELCSFHAGGSGFTAGPSIAPGMLAVTTTDTLYVFGE
eukprot:gnl/TRDRNA2_/TRDRNA2_189317_c0_seq1.p1 gnl/TRDRNA2_/TRDRNA2_189317_c0~~gnl/TRDRNA2_/TRDRNA2_189317_c0_seq1.p1  ORF type:complete len:551 (-),score=26.76 gnl/TRDRNA2_/TRDRNA2_189317_c0_seq1:74-1726(-)